MAALVSEARRSWVREAVRRIERYDTVLIVGGSGGWQIIQTDLYDELGVDCVVEGRSESVDVMALFKKAITKPLMTVVRRRPKNTARRMC